MSDYNNPDETGAQRPAAGDAASTATPGTARPAVAGQPGWERATLEKLVFATLE